MDHAGKKAGNHKGKRTATPVRAVKQPKRKSMPVQEQAGSQKGVHEELVEQMALLADANDAIIGYDAGFRVVFWNDMACSLYGYSSKEALGKLGHELLKSEYPEAPREAFLKKAEAAGRFTAESIRTTKGNRRIHVDTHVLVQRDKSGKLIGYLAVDRDITKLKDRETQLVRLNRALNALRHSSEAIEKAKDEKAFLDDVCRIIVQDCGHAMMWIGYREDDDFKSVKPAAYSGFEEGYLDTLKITWADTERGQGPTGTAVRTGKATVCRNMQTDPKFRPWRDQAVKRGYASSLSIPFFDEERVLGALTIYSKEPDPFTEDEIGLLTELADDLAHGMKVIRLRKARERIERELRVSEANAEALIKYAPAAIYEIDLERRRFISVNDVMIHMLGYTREELLSMDPSYLLDGESRASFAERIKKELSGERIDESVEYRAFRKDGAEMYGLLNVSLNASPGTPHRALVVAYDITEKKKTEEILRRSRENYRQLVESSGSIILRVDKDMRITFMNGFGLRFFGYSPNEIIGKKAVGTIIPARAENGFDTASMAEDLIRHPDNYATNVHQNVRKDGSLVWVSWANSPIYDSDRRLAEILSIGNDLSEQKEVEQALKRTESLFKLLSDIGRQLLASDNPPQIINDLCGQVLAFLDCKVFFNYLADESAGNMVLNAYAGVSDEEADRIRHLDFGLSVSGTVARDGKRIIAGDIQNTYDPLTDLVKEFGVQAYCSHPLKAQGKVIGTLSFGSRKKNRFTDEEIELMRTVADQVAMAMQRVDSEKKLRQAAHRWQITFDSIPDMVSIQDKDFRLVSVNKAYEKAFNLSSDELRGRRCYEIVHHSNCPVKDCPHDKTLKTRETATEIIYEPLLKAYLEVTTSPLFGEGGELLGTVHVAKDVTSRKKSEDELKRHREHLEELVAEQTNEIRAANAYNRRLLEVSLDPLLTISADGKLTDVNRAVELVTGVPRSRLIGSSFSDYFTEPEKAEEGYKRVLAEGEVLDYPLTIRHVSGKTTDVLYNATVYRNDNGNFQGVFAAARDITEIRRAQEEQRMLIAELARSNTDLEQFAYVASHDLQEPLRMISSYTQLLARRYKDKLDSDANEFIGFAVDGAVRLQALINSLLTYSRVGRRGNPFTEVDCHNVVAEAIVNLKAAVEESGASIETDDMPVIKGDEMQLVQLFQNLIGNSIKFRSDESPQIKISARLEDSKWVFSISDNGIGIDPQYRDRIFVIFQRLHPREKYEGTGMGLAICKKIVERHGGKIWFESAPGSGTTFFFAIPTSKE